MGSIFGSFCNVIIFRLPYSLSIIFPRSHCLQCKNSIPFYFNIPIVSFIILKGKCYYCKKRISFQYPFIEILCGLIFLFSFRNYSFPESIIFIIIVSLLLCIATIDYQHFIIPIKLSIITLLIVCFNAFISSNFIFHLYGMLIGFSYLLFILVITWIFTKKQALGYGDLILILILGLWLGPLKILLAIFFSSLLGLFYWSILSVIKGYERDRKLPFGTFLSIGSIIVYIININFIY